MPKPTKSNKKKNDKQKTTIKNYFGTATDSIYLERLEQEIQELDSPASLSNANDGRDFAARADIGT